MGRWAAGVCGRQAVAVEATAASAVAAVLAVVVVGTRAGVVGAVGAREQTQAVEPRLPLRLDRSAWIGRLCPTASFLFQ